MAAMLGLRFRRACFPDLDGLHFAAPRPLGRPAPPVCALGLERSVSHDFQIRSFPKGLGTKRSSLPQDGVAAVAQTVKTLERISSSPAGLETVSAAANTERTATRRGLMLRMIADQAEWEAWANRAEDTRTRLTSLVAELRQGPAAPSQIQLADQLFAEEQLAIAAAARAYQRVAKAQALLQGRADLQMPDTLSTSAAPNRKTPQAA